MPVHLILLIHGLYGSPKNLSTTAEELHKAALAGSGRYESSSTSLQAKTEAEPELEGSDRQLEQDEVVVHIAKSFTGSHTWDGIDVNAEKAAKELDVEIEKLEGVGKRVDRISIMGYSLGGRELVVFLLVLGLLAGFCSPLLACTDSTDWTDWTDRCSWTTQEPSLIPVVARYLAGLLSAREGFFKRHRPVSFSTAATPHLGVVRYGSRFNTLIHTVGRRLFSRSGQQLYCLDTEWDGRGILEVLADPGAS